MQLRDYQKYPVEIAIDYFRKQGSEPSLMVLPTAWGKSLLVAYVAKSIPDGEHLLVLQPSKELLEQNYEKYRSLCGDFESDAAIYSASKRKKEIGKITFATIGSIKTRGAEFKELGFKKVLIDEVHMYPREEESMIGTFLKEADIKQILGVTATPIKMETVKSTKKTPVVNEKGEPVLDKDGNPTFTRTFNGYSRQTILVNPTMQGTFYKNILYVGQIGEMVSAGFWTKLIYDKQPFDGAKLRYNTNGSDFSEKSLETSYVHNKIHDKIKAALGYYTERKHCLVFVPSVVEAKLLASETDNSAFLSASSSVKERAEVVRAFRAGEIRTVFNVGILSTGFDFPLIDLLILGFSTASISRYYQIVGRGVRIHPEKQNCLIVDMCGNLDRFGKVEKLTYRKDDRWRLIGTDGMILTGIPIQTIGCYSITDYMRLRNYPSFPSVLSFGKYKETDFLSIPSTYLQWLLRRIHHDEGLQLTADTIRHILENEVRDTTKEPPLQRMPSGIHQGEPIVECPRGYLSWYYENTEWNIYNDSLRRGVEKALQGPYQASIF